MVTKVCEKCDQTMKLVPAGVSKAKNKPYPAFWSCDARNGGCGATSRAEGDAAMAAPLVQNVVPQERLDAIERKLDEVIVMLQAV